MRIFYALAGDGMGHAIRSSVIIDHLLEKKHTVIILTSGRPFDFLSKKYDNVYHIHGINYVYEKDTVNYVKTFINVTKNMPKSFKENVEIMYKLVEKFKPNIIISDFEFFSNLISKAMNIPLISIDNAQIINKCRIKTPIKYLDERMKTYGAIRTFMLRPKKYLITTFFYPSIRNKKRVALFPPILRDKILRLNPKIKDYVLVYQTSSSNKRLIDMLKMINERFVIYGFNIEKNDKNLQFKKFNEDYFFDDLANCKAVITNGGFTLIGEALHLRKPILSIPIKHHFEQIVNAIYLKRLGYGEFYEKFTAKNIQEFLSSLEYYGECLSSYQPKNNDAIFKEIDHLINKHAKKKYKFNIKFLNNFLNKYLKHIKDWY